MKTINYLKNKDSNSGFGLVMKKISLLFLATILTFNMMAINVWDGSSEPWDEGDGTYNNPYRIATAANLAFLAEKVNEGYLSSGQAVFVNKYFLLTDDLDLNNLNWTPIGDVDYNMNGHYFSGHFDGGYHHIENLRIQTTADLAGLFAAVGNHGAQLCNLSVGGEVISTGRAASGIVGGVDQAYLTHCSFSGSVSVTNNGPFCCAAGVVACVRNGIIHECSSTATVTVSNNDMGVAIAGGLAGFVQDYGGCNKCYNTGSVSTNASLMGISGGILGSSVESATIEAYSCYNVGQVSGVTSGGIFGTVSPIDPGKTENEINIDNCFFLNSSGGNNGYGTGMTADEMRSEEFKDRIDERTHSFVMDNGTNDGYPIHSLTDFVLFEASDITNHSAKLSAWIHQGNEHLARASFYYYSFDELDEGWVNVPTDGYVEVILEGLREETEYLYALYLVFDDDLYFDSGTKSFTTGYNGVNETIHSVWTYPNPVSDILHIQGSEPAEVRVYNTMGQLMKTTRNTNEINLIRLPAGTYTLHVTTEDGKTYSDKLVKE